MALKFLPLNAISEQKLQALIQGRSAETREIEYKAEPYAKTDRDAFEFLADISSFANAAGGDIVIGMSAQNGVPIALQAIIENPEPEVLRLEQLARTGLQPRISNLSIRAVPVAYIWREAIEDATCMSEGETANYYLKRAAEILDLAVALEDQKLGIC